MSGLCVAPIVEGHGDEASVRILIQRIGFELLGGQYIEVLKPIRRKRNRLVLNKDGEIEKALNLAASKLSDPSLSCSSQLILILVDANSDPPCVLGPELLQLARSARPDRDIVCVLATVEYETWFVAAAESLSQHLRLRTGDPPADPEASRSGKAWIQTRFRGTRYSETVDQPKFTAGMDLTRCRECSRSFDKLCRELETRIAPAAVD